VLSQRAIPRYAAVKPNSVAIVDAHLAAALNETGTDTICEQGGGDNCLGIALEDSVRVANGVWSTPVLRAGVCNVEWTHGYVPPLTHVKISAEGNLEVSDTRSRAFTLNMVDERRVELFVRSELPEPVVAAVAAATVTAAQTTVPEAMVLLIKGALSVSDFSRKWADTSLIDKNVYREIYKNRVAWERMVHHCQTSPNWEVPPAATYGLPPNIPNAYRLTTQLNTDPLDIKRFKTKHPPSIICDSAGEILIANGNLLHRIPPSDPKLKTDMLMYMQRTTLTGAPDEYLLFACPPNANLSVVRSTPFALNLPDNVYNWIHSKERTEDLAKLRADYGRAGLDNSYLSENIDQPMHIATAAAV
jgi:hypothetical protein